jgi:hypothetical protein
VKWTCLAQQMIQ